MTYGRYGNLSGWWTRTAGYDKENVAIVDVFGSLDFSGRRADCNYPVTEGFEYDGVRPAMWISLK